MPDSPDGGSVLLVHREGAALARGVGLSVHPAPVHHVVQVDDGGPSGGQLHLIGHDHLEQHWPEPDDLVQLGQLLLRLIPHASCLMLGSSVPFRRSVTVLKYITANCDQTGQFIIYQIFYVCLLINQVTSQSQSTLLKLIIR